MLSRDRNATEQPVVLLLQLRPGRSGRTHSDQAADLEQLQFEHQQHLTERMANVRSRRHLFVLRPTRLRKIHELSHDADQPIFERRELNGKQAPFRTLNSNEMRLFRLDPDQTK
ncbi:hypothetical protein [Bradyrhizobium sp. C9]|uniref:hypothetical protein n=1 Tax=Bradyrhizobium sp. C9 TaxID=142585 RepID=UPI0013040173|nr:hypothetical protein [Bradyrhizobium sp. C9]